MGRPKSIIAMKGLPFTRKTEFATVIAKSLKCPLLSLDDVLDVLRPDCFPTPTSTCAAQDVAFEILCQMAKSHLQKEVSDNVVIDSPLSSQSHLDQLIKLVKPLTIFSPQSRLVIVECKPENTYSWQLKFERYLEDHSFFYTRKWYKPKNWDDIEMAIRHSYDDQAARGYGQVSKLVLDPLLDFPSFIGIGPSTHPLFMDAILYMTRREKGDGPNTVVYHQWRELQYHVRTRKQRLCRGGGHCISGYSDSEQAVLGYEANCMACAEQVTGAAYTCKDCSLALHKDCAESVDDVDITMVRPSEFTVSMMHACTSCQEDGKTRSAKCAACVFETNLKLRAMPTVIRHECEEHFLALVVAPVKVEAYLCAACGAGDMRDSYSCKICNLAYHYECLTEAPRRLTHVHGGHHHHMLLKFSTEEEAEDYVCDECQERRDPQLWSYSCQDCPYEAHLYCVLEKEERITQPPWLMVMRELNDVPHSDPPFHCQDPVAERGERGPESDPPIPVGIQPEPIHYQYPCDNCKTMENNDIRPVSFICPSCGRVVV